VFAELGLALFPASAAELSMYCSCPDWEVPCKHIAAVFYLLAEAFDDDPFSILAWRGRTREDLLSGLHAARGGGPGDPGQAGRARGGGARRAARLAASSAPPPPRRVPPPATSSASVLDQVPPLSLALRGHPIAGLLRPAYESLAGAEPEPGP